MKITKVLFEKRYNREYTSVPISDIPPEFLISENRIMIRVEEGYNDSNGWNDGQTTVFITNYREQTAKEKQEMIEYIEGLKLEKIEKQYDEFLKLKELFPNE